MQILLGLIIVAGVIMLAFFKIGNVSDVNWQTRYVFQSKEPNGLWVMMEMLKDRYGDENVVVDPSFNALNYESESSKTLYLAISDQLHYSTHQAQMLEEFIRYYDGSVMIVANSIYFESASVLATTDSTTIVKEISIDLSNDESPLIYKNYQGSFKVSNEIAYLTPSISYQENDDIIGKTDLIRVNENDVIANRVDFKYGNMVFHSLPELFTNKASLQPFFIEHLDKIMNSTNVEKIVFTLPAGQDFAKRSPISVLLENRSLKAAYYMTLFAVLCLLYFGTKRKQPKVKLITPKINTSLESAQLQARMHEVFGSNEKFIDIMEDNFYDRLFSLFGISENDPKFDQKMSKKSGVDDKMLKEITGLFKSLKANCSDRQLVRLRNLITKFTKKIKDG